MAVPSFRELREAPSGRVGVLTVVPRGAGGTGEAVCWLPSPCLFPHSEVCPKHSRVFCGKALQGHEGEWSALSPVCPPQCCGQLAKEGSPCHGCCWKAG